MSKPIRALSVCQPYAEQSLSGEKRVEYRSIPTKLKRERVYLYASKRERKDVYRKLKVEPGTYPTGVIVGTVEVVGCRKVGERDYRWQLANPVRAKRKLRPKRSPQPVWFYPFKPAA